MTTRRRSKPKKESESVDYETMLAAMDATARAITRGHAMRDLLGRARMEGIGADAPRSRAYINDQTAADEAARAAVSRRRGVNIIMLGPPHDPMQRPGTEPVYRGVDKQWKDSPASQAGPPASAGKASPPPRPATGKSGPARSSSSTTAPVELRTKDGDILEEVEDEATPCPSCRQLGHVPDGPGEYRTCPLCGGTGALYTP
jgi:hypothetical protein